MINATISEDTATEIVAETLIQDYRIFKIAIGRDPDDFKINNAFKDILSYYLEYNKYKDWLENEFQENRDTD